MKKFVLIEVTERDICTPYFFNTFKEAHEEMESHAKVCKDYEIEESSAYGETLNHDNWDAKIFSLIFN